MSVRFLFLHLHQRMNWKVFTSLWFRMARRELLHRCKRIFVIFFFYGGGHPSGDCLSRGHSHVSVTKTCSIVRCMDFLRRRLPVHCSHCVAEVVNKHLVSSRTWLGMSKEYLVKYLSLLASAELVVLSSFDTRGERFFEGLHLLPILTALDFTLE